MGWEAEFEIPIIGFNNYSMATSPADRRPASLFVTLSEKPNEYLPGIPASCIKAWLQETK
jgi:hypothetical protein